MLDKITMLEELIAMLEEDSPLRLHLEEELAAERNRLESTDGESANPPEEPTQTDGESAQAATMATDNTPASAAREAEDSQEPKTGQESGNEQETTPDENSGASAGQAKSNNDRSGESQSDGQEKTTSDSGDAFENLLKTLDDLLDDDTFIAASAGFVLGAAVMGLGTALASSMNPRIRL